MCTQADGGTNLFSSVSTATVALSAYVSNNNAAAAETGSAIHAVHICPIGYDFGQARMRNVLTSVAIFSSVGKQIVARLSLTITKD